MLTRAGILAGALLVVGCQDSDAVTPPAKATVGRAAPAKHKAVNKAVLDFEGVMFSTPAGKSREFNCGGPGA